MRQARLRQNSGPSHAFCELRGWNKTTGRPTKEDLEEPGLEEAAEELATKVRQGEFNSLQRGLNRGNTRQRMDFL